MFGDDQPFERNVDGGEGLSARGGGGQRLARPAPDLDRRFARQRRRKPVVDIFLVFFYAMQNLAAAMNGLLSGEPARRNKNIVNGGLKPVSFHHGVDQQCTVAVHIKIDPR